MFSPLQKILNYTIFFFCVKLYILGLFFLNYCYYYYHLNTAKYILQFNPK